MTPARDPFYIVKGEIQDSIDKLQTSFRQWEYTPKDTGEHIHLTKDLITSCESIEWQVDELDKAIQVAAKDPARYSLDEIELEKRRKWTSTSRDQVLSAKGGEGDLTIFYTYVGMKRQQDEELDELSATVQRIGGIGLTIHDELVGQDRILDELNLEMETTSNRLDFVQKKVAVVMKKAGAKGQIMMIGFLIVLFMIIFVLVFFT